MLLAYQNEIRAAVERVAEAERQARKMVGSIVGREEKYTEVFRTHLERELNGFSEGGVTWHVLTYTTDKQSGQEGRIGADLVVALGVELGGARQWKGFLVQAKVNHNVRYGVSVDSFARLKGQCADMLRHTKESYVFAYGNQSTKVLKAGNVIAGAPLSQIPDKAMSEFFGDVMMCWLGDPAVVANDHRQLETLVRQMEGKSGVLIKASEES